MRSGLIRCLLKLYPSAWRERYGAEFGVFLEEHPGTSAAVLNVVLSAFAEHLKNEEAFMTWQQRTLVLMAVAYLAAVAAGVNFYWSVADTPLAAAMRDHAPLATAFRAVAAGSVAALAAVLLVAVPATAALSVDALKQRRWSILCRVAVPFAAVLVLVAWLAIAALATHGSWIPTPWDVAGDWAAPPQWPAPSTRAVMASVTLLVMVCGLAASGTAATQVIRRTDFSTRPALPFKVTSIGLAISVVVMTAAALAWGWLAQQYVAADFHARNGGFFTSTNVTSWAASIVVFGLASVMAIRSATTCLKHAD